MAPAGATPGADGLWLRDRAAWLACELATITDAYEAALTNYPDGELPSIDEKMAECLALPAEEINACYAEMEVILMEEAMPWVPVMWGKQLVFTSPSVTQYVFDQNAGDNGWAHIAVNNGLEPVNVA